VRDNSHKLSFKERRELEQLTTEIDALTAEKKQLDTLFASGEVITDMDTKSARYSELQQLLEEKEMRWLELSEKE
jgi:ATP-binding cassette subfamily F protein uup